MSLVEFRRARLTRDPRFDGQFFVAARTTGVYCRPICSSRAPKEGNVTYFNSAIEAATQGYRPCLRCAPESAPALFSQMGLDTTLERALRLLDGGVLIGSSVRDVSDRLAISRLDLEELFERTLGVSPDQYSQYQQLLFAKSLLQQTGLSITEVALMAGFDGVRRFNDVFARLLKITPSELRRRRPGRDSFRVRLFLSYRPPYDWSSMRDFLQARLIPELEWCGTDHYGRTFCWQSMHGEDLRGRFTVYHRPERCGFDVIIEPEHHTLMLPIVRNIRRVLDLDADIASIDEQLAKLPGLGSRLRPGLRLPGIWDPFEAGVRAILGQQVSVAAARRLVATLVDRIGPLQGDKRLFPLARDIADTPLDFLKMPGSRRDTLKRFAEFYIQQAGAPHPDLWEELKGIGPWTVSYVRMRGLSDSNIWLGTDLGVQRTMERQIITLDPEDAAPWKSYLTFQLWHLA